ncbi:hypothetical protein [Pseudothauera rhizosphaerae]|uniref:Uncharacterized protein n=1 Tax=Pseudothauera rhizosphaerae TaxID=2565932 RepID=A0A4V3W9T5_9RHOO|nr:hypothetical protein [Pseudothauera rhizosphaerae]THF56541.1 hypothetical protein E6O51_19195 [Pseudothauera rhizosphaerae]
MMEMVQQYYANERQFALFGIGMGAVLSILAAALWRASAAASLGTGMAYVLLVAGLLQAAASFSYVMIVDRRAEDAAKTYLLQLESEVKRDELVRMQKVFSSGYTGALATYTALLFVGVALVFLAINVPIWKGVALGLMIVGVIGHGVEAFSMQANRDYKAAVEAYASINVLHHFFR